MDLSCCRFPQEMEELQSAQRAALEGLRALSREVESPTQALVEQAAQCSRCGQVPCRRAACSGGRPSVGESSPIAYYAHCLATHNPRHALAGPSTTTTLPLAAPAGAARRRVWRGACAGTAALRRLSCAGRAGCLRSTPRPAAAAGGACPRRMRCSGQVFVCASVCIGMKWWTQYSGGGGWVSKEDALQRASLFEALSKPFCSLQGLVHAAPFRLIPGRC